MPSEEKLFDIFCLSSVTALILYVVALVAILLFQAFFVMVIAELATIVWGIYVIFMLVYITIKDWRS